MKSIWKKNKKNSLFKYSFFVSYDCVSATKNLLQWDQFGCKDFGGVRTYVTKKKKEEKFTGYTNGEIDLITLPLSQKNLYTTIYIYIYTIHNYTYENVTIRLEHRSNQPLKRLYTKLSNHTLWIVAILKLNSLTKTVFNNLKAFESIVGTLIIGVC
jgi:hypothetical protein